MMIKRAGNNNHWATYIIILEVSMYSSKYFLNYMSTLKSKKENEGWNENVRQ